MNIHEGKGLYSKWWPSVRISILRLLLLSYFDCISDSDSFNALSATYNLQQTTISNFAAF